MEISNDVMKLIQDFNINIENLEIRKIVETIVEEKGNDINELGFVFFHLNDSLNPHKVGDTVKEFVICEVINEDWYVEYLATKDGKTYLIGHNGHIWNEIDIYEMKKIIFKKCFGF